MSSIKPPRRSLRTARTSCRAQSQGYSAHIGQEAKIHYRWHALYGRPVRRYYAEVRSGAEVVVVEGQPGAAIVVAAWMLDPAVCAGMQIGAPHVSVEALTDLHRLLIEHRLRRSFSDDADVVQEALNEERVTADYEDQTVTPAQHSAGFRGVTGDDCSRTQHGARSVGSSPDGSRRRRGQGERR